MRLRLDTPPAASTWPAASCTVTGPGGAEDIIGYDELVIGTGAVPARPPIAGLDALGPGDGVHLLHSMDDTFAVMRTLEDTAPGQRGHRRRGLHRPGDGRRADHPGTAR